MDSINYMLIVVNIGGDTTPVFFDTSAHLFFIFLGENFELVQFLKS